MDFIWCYDLQTTVETDLTPSAAGKRCRRAKGAILNRELEECYEMLRIFRHEEQIVSDTRPARPIHTRPASSRYADGLGGFVL